MIYFLHSTFSMFQYPFSMIIKTIITKCMPCVYLITYCRRPYVVTVVECKLGQLPFLFIPFQSFVVPLLKLIHEIVTGKPAFDIRLHGVYFLLTCTFD